MKVALVTGASRGLGVSIAKALAKDGWSVAVNYARDDANAALCVRQIGAEGGRAALAKFDVTDEQAVRSGIGRIETELGSVDLIVNNATGVQPDLSIMEQTWEDHLAQLLFFVKAPLLLLQAVLPDWRKRKSGRIINIGSEVVDIGNARFAHYVAAKSAMVGLTRSWAQELGPDGITVNLVAPGWIPVERHENVDQASLEQYRRQVPLRSMGKPDDIAGMVVYLASDRASFITGQTFSVNGGRTFA